MGARASKVWSVGVLAFLAWSGPVRAAYKPAAQLQSELAAFLGKDAQGRQRYAKLAWTREIDDAGRYGRIDVMDTKDGNCHPLTTALKDSAGYFFDANITPDGARVVFGNPNNGDLYVCNWDGTGLRKVATGWRLSRTWRNPADGSDWAIVASLAPSNKGTTGFKAVYRMDIDDTSKKVLLWDKTEMDSQAWGFWASLSGDGKVLGGTFPWNLIGFADAGNGSGPTFTGAQGCWTSLAKDNSYNLLSTVNDHWAARLYYHATGKDTVSRLPAGYNGDPTNGPSFNFLRWSDDQDIVVSEFDKRPSPVVQRFHDPYQWVTLQDSHLDFRGINCDMRTYAGEMAADAPPAITNPGRLTLIVGKSNDLVVFVRNSPAPTLEATGLPAGLALQGGNVPANSFHIKGTPTALGSFEVTLKATNSKGSDQKTFTLVVSAANQAPAVDAGPAVAGRVGQPISLVGTVTDDGLPNADPKVHWREKDGPCCPEITFSDAASAITQVTTKGKGSFLFELSADDGEYTSTDTVRVTVQDSVPFKVLKPAAGEQVAIGSTYTVQWQMDPAEGCNVYLSTDGAKSWKMITPDGAVGTDGTTTWKWKVDSTLQPGAAQLKLEHYFVHTTNTVGAPFQLVRGATALAHGWRGPGWEWRPQARGLRLEVPPGAGFGALRLRSADGKRALERRWPAGAGWSGALEVPPGLYLFELSGPRGGTVRGMVPALR